MLYVQLSSLLSSPVSFCCLFLVPWLNEMEIFCLRFLIISHLRFVSFRFVSIILQHFLVSYHHDMQYAVV